MPRYAHRVAFNCDLFMTITTDSADTDGMELERLAVQAIRAASPSDLLLLTDIGLGVQGLYGAAVYPRHSTAPPDSACPEDDAQVQLENFTVEDCSEVTG